MSALPLIVFDVNETLGLRQQTRQLMTPSAAECASQQSRG
jgi:hypothetical protein